MATTAVRGTFLDFVDDPWRHVGAEQESARFHADGLLVISDGRVADFGPYAEVRARHPQVPVTEIADRLILPGFVDGHIHFPQTRVLGAYGEQLLPWLQKSVFPEERKYADREYAQLGAQHFFDNLLASGTTTIQAFTSSAPVCTEELFLEATRRNLRVISGITAIDQNAPDWFTISPADFEAAAKDQIARFHRQGATCTRSLRGSPSARPTSCSGPASGSSTSTRTCGCTPTSRRTRPRSAASRRCTPAAPTTSRSTRSSTWSARNSPAGTASG